MLEKYQLYATIFCGILAFILISAPANAGPTHDLQAVCEGTKPRDVTNNCPECTPQHNAVKKEAQAIRNWVKQKAAGLQKPLICGVTERAQAKARLTSLAQQISNIATEVSAINEWFEDVKSDPDKARILDRETSYPEESSYPEGGLEEITPQNEVELKDSYSRQIIEEYGELAPFVSGFTVVVGAAMVVEGSKNLKKTAREAAVEVSELITEQLQNINNAATNTSLDKIYSEKDLNKNTLQNTISTLHDFNALSLSAKIAKNLALLSSLNKLKDLLWQEQQDLRARLLIDSEIASLSALLDRHDATIVGLANCQKDRCKPKPTSQSSPTTGSGPASGPDSLPVATVPRPTEQPAPVITLPEPAKPTQPSNTGLGTIAGTQKETLSPDTVNALGQRSREGSAIKVTRVTCRQNAIGNCNNFPTKKEREKCLALSQAYIKACEKADISEATFSNALPSNNCGIIKNYCQVTTKLAQDLKPMVIAARTRVDNTQDSARLEKIRALEGKRDKHKQDQSEITGQKRYFYYNTKTKKIYTHKKLFIAHPYVQFLGDAPSVLGQKDKDTIEKLQEKIDAVEKQITELRVSAKSKVAWDEDIKSKYRYYLNHNCMTRSPAYFAKRCHRACNRHFQPDEGFTPAPEAAGYSALSQFPCGTLTKVDWQQMYKPGTPPKFIYDYAKSYKIYNKLR